jgi:phosphatidylinositol alpha-1,6-mannosyltransferase
MRTAIADADALCLRAPGPIAMCAWRLGRHRPFAVEVVGDPHDAFAPGAVRSALRPLARSLATHGLRTLCRQAVAVAYVAGTTLRERYPAGRWSTSYTSLDLGEDAFATDAQIAARRLRWIRPEKGTQGDPWRLVCIGTFAQLYKGQDVLIDAVARCRARAMHVDLTLVGDGIHRAALERRTARDGLCSVVRFAGQVPPDAGVRGMLDAADVFVLPSRAEGLPRALLEAMAWGVPSIASRVGGNPELLPSDRLVVPGDAAGLAGTLARLCTPATDVAALAAADRSVARRFAASVLRPRRVELYRRLRTAAVEHGPRSSRERLFEAPVAG